MGDAKYLWILGLTVVGWYFYSRRSASRQLQISSAPPQAIKGGLLMPSSANTANVDVTTSYGRDPCPAGFSLQPSAEHGAEHLVCRPSGLAQNKWAGNGNGKGIKGIHYGCAPGHSLQNTSRQIGASRECRPNLPFQRI